MARLSKAEYDDMMELVDGCLAIDAACLAAPEFATLRKVCDRLVFCSAVPPTTHNMGRAGKMPSKRLRVLLLAPVREVKQ